MPDCHHSGRSTILVVDDDMAIVEFATSILTQNGYRVISAISGADAAELIRGREAEITLLLLDVVMPEMTGPQLADRVSKTNPGVRILFMSGWDEGVIARHGAFRRNVRTIMKPFTPEGLVDTIETVLQDPITQSS